METTQHTNEPQRAEDQRVTPAPLHSHWSRPPLLAGACTPFRKEKKTNDASRRCMSSFSEKTKAVSASKYLHHNTFSFLGCGPVHIACDQSRSVRPLRRTVGVYKHVTWKWKLSHGLRHRPVFYIFYILSLSLQEGVYVPTAVIYADGKLSGPSA